MPGVFAALVSCIVIALSGNKGFPNDYFAAMGENGKVADQVWAQICALFVTLAISICSGAIGGWICNRPLF